MNSLEGGIFFFLKKKALTKTSAQEQEVLLYSNVSWVACSVSYRTYSKTTFAPEAVEPVVSKQLYLQGEKSPDNE